MVNALKGGFSQQKLDKPVDTRYLRSSRSSKDLPPVPDGYATVKDMAKELGLEDGTMLSRLARELAKKGKITMGVYRSEENRRIFAFTREDARIIVDEKRRRTRSIPEGLVGVRDIMDKTGAAKHIVRSTAEKLGLLDKVGLPIIFSPSEAEEICAAIEGRQPIPEGYVPVTEFVREDQQRRGRQDVSYGDVWRAIEQLELIPVKAGGVFYLSEDEAGQVAAKVEQLVSERLAVKRREKVSLNRLSDVTGEDYSVVRRAAEKCGLIEKGASSRGRYFSVAEQEKVIKYLEERRARRARAKGQLGGAALK